MKETGNSRTYIYTPVFHLYARFVIYFILINKSAEYAGPNLKFKWESEEEAYLNFQSIDYNRKLGGFEFKCVVGEVVDVEH